MHCAGHSFGGAVAACLAGLLDGAIDVETAESRGNGLQRGRPRDGEGGRRREGENGGADGDENASPRGRVDSDAKGPRKPGLSARGKSRDASESLPGREGHERGREGEEEIAVKVDEAAPWVGLCADKVTCVTLGCPPCLSPNLRLPFVTSFVLGDDMVPRTSRESLRRLKRRLLQASERARGWSFTLPATRPSLSCCLKQKEIKYNGTLSGSTNYTAARAVHSPAQWHELAGEICPDRACKSP